MKVSSLELGHSVNGDAQTLKVYEFDSGRPGPEVYIQSGMHGAELQGHTVIAFLIDWLKNNEFNGKWTLVPFANPYSISHYSGEFTGGRFDPISGHNWNRDYYNLLTENNESDFAINISSFVKELTTKDSEQIKEKFKQTLTDKIAAIEKSQNIYGTRLGRVLSLKLQSLFITADIVLDLHTAHASQPYLYGPEDCKDEIKAFGMPSAILIPHEFADACDESAFVPWSKLNTELKAQGIPGVRNVSAFTLELGNQEVIDSGQAIKDGSSVLNYLKSKNCHNTNIEIEKNSTVFTYLKNFKTYFAKQTGLYEFLASPGDRIKKGQPLYRYLSGKNELNWTSVNAIEDCFIVSRANSSNVRHGSQIYQVMENIFN